MGRFEDIAMSTVLLNQNGKKLNQDNLEATDKRHTLAGKTDFNVPFSL